MSEPATIFLQERSSKAGAQVGLLRYLSQEALRPLNPLVVTSSEGWLTEACTAEGIPFHVEAFPKSRSLPARLAGNRAFARKVLDRLDAPIRLVVGNDHLEGLLTGALARAARAPSAIILRSSEITLRDFLKYNCPDSDGIFAVGDELRGQVAAWVPDREIDVLYDGLDESEFAPPKEKAPAFPTRIFVAGSDSHYKGWQDLAAAIDILEERDPDFPALEFDFTGPAPTSPLNDMRLDKERRANFHFIGKVPNLAAAARDYDLSIHASREESFGLAPIEILAGGAPLLCSRAGIIEKVRHDRNFLFDCHSPESFADALANLRKNWTTLDLDLASCQQRIRDQFLIPDLATGLANRLKALSD